MYTHIAYLSIEHNSRPIGLRMVEPPPDTLQAVRGKLYVVIEYGDNDPTQVPLVEKALSVIQSTYYSVQGTQTFVLTEALRQGLALFASTVDSTQPPGILLMALIGNKLSAVGAGPVIALLTSGKNVDVYPPYVADANTAKRDGRQQNTLEFYRNEVPLGGTVLLAGQRALQHFTLRELASIVAYVTEENVANVAQTLRNQAGEDALTGLVIVISPDDDRAPAPTSPDGQSSATPQSRATPLSPLQRLRRTALPGALSGQLASRGGDRGAAQRPVQADSGETRSTALPTAASAEHDVAGQRPTAHEYADTGYDDALSAHAYASDEDAYYDNSPEEPYDSAVGEAAVPNSRGVQGGENTGGAIHRENAPRRATVDDEVPAAAIVNLAQQTMGQIRTFFAGMLPEQKEASTDLRQEQAYVDGGMIAPHEDDDWESDENENYEGTAQSSLLEQPPATASAADLHNAAWAESQAATPDAASYAPRPVPTPVRVPQRANGRRARLFALAALVILLLTVVIVASVYWATGRSNLAAADEFLARAEASYLSAQSALEAEDEATARLHLNDAQAYIAEANNVVGTPLERGDQLNARIELQLAELLKVQPLHALTVPLVTFPDTTAQPRRVIVQDQDIYVLDPGRKLVQLYLLDQTRTLVEDLAGETIITEGEVIDGVTVGRLVDITWLPAIAGIQDRAYLLILDGNNNLFRFDRRVEGANYVELGGRDLLRSPVRMQVYFDRLYLVDAGQNQIYRYERGDFASTPTPWLNTQTEHNLSTVRAMAIDGSIWLLFEQGLLARYDAGNQVQFSLETSFGQIDEPVDLAIGNEGTSLVYVADGVGERVLVFRKTGEYVRQLRAPEGDALRNLRSIHVDEVSGVMYLMTQSALFQHPIIE